MFLPDLPVSEQRKDLYAALGVGAFDGRKAAASTRVATTGRPLTASSASRPLSVAWYSCQTMFAPRQVSPSLSGLSLVLPTYPTTGNMAITLGSRKFGFLELNSIVMVTTGFRNRTTVNIERNWGISLNCGLSASNHTVPSTSAVCSFPPLTTPEGAQFCLAQSCGGLGL